MGRAWHGPAIASTTKSKGEELEKKVSYDVFKELSSDFPSSFVSLNSAHLCRGTTGRTRVTRYVVMREHIITPFPHMGLNDR